MLKFLIGLALTLAPAQGGYTTEEFPEHGLTIPRPRSFVLAPLPVDVRFRVVYFEERQSVAEREEHSQRPLCFVVRIDGDPAGALAATNGGKLIVDFDGYLAEYHSKFARSAPRSERERDGYAGTEHDLIPDGDSVGSAWCYVFERSKPTPRTFALIGYCGKPDLKDLVPIWREMAAKMRFADPVPLDHSGLNRLYARKAFRDQEQRIEQRKRLLRGWDAEDTQHYIVLVHSPRKPYLKRVLSDAEAMRSIFDSTFTLDASTLPLGTVRLCESRDEYLVYGGDPRYAALWNDAISELVLFDPVQDGDRSGEEAALATLRGQLFAQYSQSQLGALAHPWFLQGHIDYYSSCQVSGNSLKVRSSRGLASVQSQIEKGNLMPSSELMRLHSQEFGKRKGFFPSGSLVYFLRESKEARAEARWSSLLDRYLTTLLATDEARRTAGDSTEVAREAAREAAIDAALEGVDLDALDKAWTQATLRLKVD